MNGAVLGFSIAAPVGPIGLLVIRQSLSRGARAGLRCGLGAALADLCYGALAAGGVTLLAQWQQPAALCGGLLLCWLAWKAWRAEAAQPAGGSGFTATFLLTLSNPMTILAFAALVAGAGAASPGWFMAGVFSGSLAWWLVLSSTASALRGRFPAASMVWLNRASAAVLFAFGVRALSTAACGLLA
ncbi:MAG: LysE family transporter [Acidobacteria bacterium]|nr:LysE family transporter [Acidobacteriota bacterium]